jgi:hypothetical protein
LAIVDEYVVLVAFNSMHDGSTPSWTTIGETVTFGVILAITGERLSLVQPLDASA